MAEIRDVYTIEFDSASFEAQIQSAVSKIDQLNASLEDSADATNGLESATSNLNSILKTEASGVDQLNAKRNVLVSTQKNLNKESESYNAIGTEINNTNKKISTSTAQIATKSRGLFGTFVSGARSLNSVRRSVSLLNVAFRTLAGVSVFGLIIQGAQLLASLLGGLFTKADKTSDALERLNDPKLGLTEQQAIARAEIERLDALEERSGRLSKKQKEQRDELVQKFEQSSEQIKEIERDRIGTLLDLESKLEQTRIKLLGKTTEAIDREAELRRKQFLAQQGQIFSDRVAEINKLIEEETRLRNAGKSIEADAVLDQVESVSKQIQLGKELQDATLEQIKQEAQLKKQQLIENAVLSNSITDLQKKISELRKVQRSKTNSEDKNALLSTEAQIKALQDQLNAAESALNDFRTQTAARERIEKLQTDLIEDETAKRIESLRRSANKELQSVIGSESQKAEQRRLISEKLNRDIAKITADRTKKENDEINKGAEEARAATKSANDQFLSDAEKNAQRLLSVRLQAIEAERNAELQSISVAGTDAETRNQAVTDANERFNNKRIQAERETQSEILLIQIAGIEQRIRAQAAAGESVSAESAELEKLRLKLVELQRIDPTVKIVVDDSDARKKLKDTIKEIAGTVEQISNELLGSINEFLAVQTDALNQSVQRSRDALATIRQDSENFNARQLELEKQRLERLEQQRARAAEREKAIALTQLTVNSLVAVSKAAADGGVLAPFTIASTIIALLAGFASARNASENAFFEGTEYVDPHNKYPAGRDTVPARLHKGERVITTATNREYFNTLSAIHNGDIPAGVLDDFVSGYLREGMSPNAMTQLSPNIVLVNTGSNSGGVEKRLERIESVLADLPKNMPRTTIKSDMAGILRVVEKRQARANFNNNRSK